MKTDIEIAQSTRLAPVTEIAAGLGIGDDELELYGRYKAKVSEEFIRRADGMKRGKLILVTAINPTPAGEGKTTTSIGLSMALNRIGKKSVVALREPSLGPVFGVKGGAAGGGYSQVLPMEDINLHFTGDFHAITSANNLLCAMIDNHLHQGNALGIDPRRIRFARVLDMNDRALRGVVVGLGGTTGGIPREEHFTITVASEVMAILCLADSLSDLKARLGSILVAYTYGGSPVWARDIGADGAMTALLRDALKPNLVQTTENTPAIIHGGPFANIAHGCNSVRATKLALALSDYAVTEAGFGSDLGAEKFFDIKCRLAGLKPDVTVLVATVRALKYNGGVKKDELKREDTEALARGAVNLEAHIEGLQKYGVRVVVALNRFETDTDAEIDYVVELCRSHGVSAAVSEIFAKGGEGGVELAERVVEECGRGSDFHCLYPNEMPIKEKIRTVAREIYGADDVVFEAAAEKSLGEIAALGAEYERLPVCMAKTQYSLSDDASKLGRPHGFTVTVRNVSLSAGAGFIVALTGAIMTMPGLPKTPAANSIDVDADGRITGLF